VQHNVAVFNVHSRLRVGGYRFAERSYETGLPRPHILVSTSELLKHVPPAYRSASLEVMQAVGKPHIDIERGRTVFQLLDRSVPERNGMAPQLFEEFQIKEHTVFEERLLPTIFPSIVMKEKPGLDDAFVGHHRRGFTAWFTRSVS